MANNDSATPITTGTQVGNRLKERGIYYFKLGSEYFLYDEDEQRLCGLTGAEIDSNFHFLSGYDIKDVELNYSAGTVTITRVNDGFEPIVLDLVPLRPEYSYDPEMGKLTVTYPDGEEKEVEGFFIDEGKYDLKVYTDGTLDGLGTEFNPLSLSRLERTGTFAPVETLVSGDTSAYKGKRILTKELIDDYGRLYSYDEVEAIQAALEAENSPWRVATKKDWDEMLNALEIDPEDRTHDASCSERNYGAGQTASDILKSSRLWEYPNGNTPDESAEGYVGFDMLPVGYDTFPETATNDDQAELFGTNAGFWAMSDAEYCETDLPLVKLFNTGSSVEQRGVQPDGLFSVRLVRECVPGCPEEFETILGSTYPVGPIVGPCDVEYCKIWTLSNFYSSGDGFTGKAISGTNVPEQTEYAYFINECDGNKKRMMEGESVVILDRCRHEWRVIDGELVDTYDEVKNDIAELSGNLLTHIDEFSAGTVSELEALQSGLNSLAEETAETDAAISGRVESVNERVSQSNLTLTNNISSLSADTYNAINDLAAATNAAMDSLSERVVVLEVSAATKGELEQESERAMAAEGVMRSGFTADIAATNANLAALSGTVAEYQNGNLDELDSINNDIDNLESDVEELSASTVGISSTLNNTITELHNAEDSLTEAIGDASVSTLAQAKTYTDEQVDAINAVKVNDLYFDNLSKYIKLIKADGSLTDGISAEDFLKDSVLTSVEYDEGNEKLIFIWDDSYATKTEISLSKLSNVYGIGQDSLAFLKLSGTNISAIVDNADGFGKTLATTKFVENIASATNAVLAELIASNNENREDIDTLNGDKNTAGSVQHSIDDKINTALLTAGLPITTVTVEEARNNSLLRKLVVNGEEKYFASNDARDMIAQNANGQSVALNTYINALETKVATLESENTSLKNRVAVLEQRVDDIAATGIDETMVRNIVKNMLVGTDKEIKVTETGELGQKLQIGFADNAIFGDYLTN